MYDELGLLLIAMIDYDILWNFLDNLYTTQYVNALWTYQM
jgi:hypothetical protein